MSKNNPIATNFMQAMNNQELPLDHRAQQLIDVCIKAKEGEDQCIEALNEIFERMESASADETVAKMKKHLEELLRQIEMAPLRPATFIELSRLEGCRIPHALVSLDSGDFGYIATPKPDEVKKYRLGDRVALDGNGKVLLFKESDALQHGKEATFERSVDDKHIEVKSAHDEKIVVIASRRVVDDIKEKRLKVGGAVILNKGEHIALCSLPNREGEMGELRYLDRSPIPDVIVDRDIGQPPRVIREVATHIREEMLRPELRRKFRLRPCMTYLLSGVSGTGKTLSVQAIHHLMYDIMAEVTGAPVEQLPPRVVRFKNSKLFSMWLGESEKNFDRIFDEVEYVAEQTFTYNGRTHRLPVLVVMEEIDGLGRARGSSADAVFDRILTTTLQRLDPTRSALANKLVVFLSTTNEPHIVDPAMLRRIGGKIEHFGRLNQEGFHAVLSKHVRGLPVEGDTWKPIVEDLDKWLFREENRLIELCFHDVARPHYKSHKDFLTGALVERAVAEAATEAWQESIKDKERGLDAHRLRGALHRQVMSVANQLTEHNADRYLDLPEGWRVSSIRSLQEA